MVAVSLSGISRLKPGVKPALAKVNEVWELKEV